MNAVLRLAPLAFLALLPACLSLSGDRAPGVSWGEVDGEEVRLYTLRNDNGLVMKVTNYGAIITQLHVPDRNGKLADVVLGHDSLEGYLDGHPYFGCIAGRYANRIAKGRFRLGSTEYRLACNNGPNHLHGGDAGFDKKVWHAAVGETMQGPSIRLTLVSPNGEEGYPGTLSVSVTYTLTNDDELLVKMTASTDATTVCNLAQHTYWNLAGHASGANTDHLLTMSANRYTPVDDTLIPTGELAPVFGTPFDFTRAKPIGRELAATGGDPRGYDHNFVLNGAADELKLVASVHEPTSGRSFELYANQPGCQFYSGNFLDGSDVGKGGAVYEQYGGFCLETQRYPDSIHHPEWPSPILRPGEEYEHTMVYRFSAK